MAADNPRGAMFRVLVPDRHARVTNAELKHAIRGFLRLSHIAGIIAFAAIGWFGHDLSPLWPSILTTAIMIMVAVWESLSLSSKPEE